MMVEISKPCIPNPPPKKKPNIPIPIPIPIHPPPPNPQTPTNKPPQPHLPPLPPRSTSPNSMQTQCRTHPPTHAEKSQTQEKYHSSNIKALFLKTPSTIVNPPPFDGSQNPPPRHDTISLPLRLLLAVIPLLIERKKKKREREKKRKKSLFRFRRFYFGGSLG